MKTGERPHRGAAASPADVEAVSALLGRVPNGEFVVVVRRRDGRPAVIANDPHLRDGAPMPTRFWLVDPEIRALVGRLESRGGVRRAESDIGPELLQEAHARYAQERDALIPPGRPGPRPHGGVGGTRNGVKCLHAHLAWWLAGGDDPVGRWVTEQVDLPTFDLVVQ
ncbi:MAG: DUF501 domain-containing protein [Acidimicrobiales bacterium]